MPPLEGIYWDGVMLPAHDGGIGTGIYAQVPSAMNSNILRMSAWWYGDSLSCGDVSSIPASVSASTKHTERVWHDLCIFYWDTRG
jgi:hypothetical protein